MASPGALTGHAGKSRESTLARPRGGRGVTLSLTHSRDLSFCQELIFQLRRPLKRLGHGLDWLADLRNVSFRNAAKLHLGTEHQSRDSFDGQFHESAAGRVDGGKIRFLPNWFKPTRVGRLREQLFVKVPITYSALRFARSLFDTEY